MLQSIIFEWVFSICMYWLFVDCRVPPKHVAVTKECAVVYIRGTYLLTYLLTPCSRVLFEKLTGSQLFKKFPEFYGNRRFITTFTSTRQLSLPWASSIQSIPPHSTSWTSILILSCWWFLRSWLFKNQIVPCSFLGLT
jgi:hypothetical protein